jgi:hypothetical protein
MVNSNTPIYRSLRAIKYTPQQCKKYSFVKLFYLLNPLSGYLKHADPLYGPATRSFLKADRGLMRKQTELVRVQKRAVKSWILVPVDPCLPKIQ